MEIIKGMNLAVRFLLELSALVALGYWGSQAGKGLPLKVGMGLGTPLVAAMVWGTYLAPHSSMRLSGILQLALEAVIFGAAAVGLAAAGRPHLAWALILTAVVNRFLMAIWRQ